MPLLRRENWNIAKPEIRSRHGIVVAQHARAAAVGAEILAAGGNAVDAAVATAFALGVVEPWMSGIGGVGFLVYGEAATGRVQVVDFSAVAPSALDPRRYPVIGGKSDELFAWPRVEGDRNLKGYESICVPGSVDGLGLAVERFGRLRFADVIAPACRLAEEGLPIDWYAAFNVSLSAADLGQFAAAREIYLPGGLPPVPAPDGAPRRLALPALARTYRRLAETGRREFYEGDVAAMLLADLREGGSVISADDLAGYRARLVEPLSFDYRGVRLHATPGLAGGVTYAHAMTALDARLPRRNRSPAGADAFLAYAETLRAAFAARFAELGHAMPGASNTTHLSVVDRAGNMVALTNTLLSRFGSKVALPKSGVMMNNAVMWFDPTPGRPNSIAAGKRPLANMCPVVATRDGAPSFALGACGGRRIISAVTQLTSFVVDFGMALEQAMALPRLDASEASVIVDDRLAPEIIAALRSRFPVDVVEAGVYPPHFAIPSAVLRDAASGFNTGATHVRSPASAAIAETAS
ncbi:MAG TPA: gamma-glutamyltransferase [Stellaceae bacterium]|nr:gamma-glutamyltransferase [Stellaceae bacterium]